MASRSLSIFGWITAQALAQCALWLGLYAPLKLLLPLLADQLAQPGPGAREGLLAAATLAGSLVALVANPLAGALSDRQRGARGGRAAWILAGSLLAAIAIALLPGAGSALGLVGLWLLAKLGLNTCLAGVQGSAADRVPLGQQGSLWGWVGLAQPLGLVLGVAIGTLLLPRLQLAALALGALVPLACGPLLRLEWRAGAPLHRISRQEARQQPREGSLLAPFRHRPFAGLWWSRFWLYLGWSMSTVYLLYFLEERVGLPRPQALVAQALLLALYAGGTVASAALAGRASDRSGHRLGFVLVGSGGMAAACALFLVSQSLPLALLAATLLGVAYGVYVPSHQALVVAHLPSAHHLARDLGVFNAANTAPQVLAPACAWLLVTQLGGYTTLFAATTVLFLASNLPLWWCGLRR